MSKKRKIILAAAIVLILVSGASLLRDFLEERRSEELYAQLAQEVTQEPETEQETEPEEETQAPYVSPVDFERLWEINSNIVGWLTIPDTAIDYPIVHDPESNDTYLTRDIEGNESVAGSIYLDCDNEPDFSDYHNVIYGHHMRNGTMFADIMEFRDQEFLESHPDITIYLPERAIHLKAYACLYTTPDGFRRKTQFDTVKELQEYADEMVQGATAYVEPEQEITRLFSFVTCSYEFNDARTILYCYEVTDQEQDF